MAEANSTVTYRNIDGLPGYRVGDDGSVWTCLKHRIVSRDSGLIRRGGSEVTQVWRKLTPWVGNKHGHLQVRLQGRTRSVHRLVLEAFVGPRPPGMVACHGPDRDPANNRVTNLRWDTRKANSGDRLAQGTLLFGTRHPLAVVNEELVRQIRSEYKKGVVGVPRLAARYGVSRTCVFDIVTRKTWDHVK